MINRDYLPYQSAREYIDRGMAKWTGFFLSEHSKALCNKDDVVNISNQMNDEEKLLTISQVYINKLKIQLYTSLKTAPFIGYICDVIKDKIYFKTKNNILVIKFSEIIRLCLENKYDE